MNDPEEDWYCECHDNQQQHEKDAAEAAAYWRAYFGSNLAAFDPRVPTAEEIAEMLALK